MGSRSKGMLYGAPREKNPLRDSEVIRQWRFFWTAPFPRPPKKACLKSGKRFKNCRKGSTSDQDRPEQSERATSLNAEVQYETHLNSTYKRTQASGPKGG